MRAWLVLAVGLLSVAAVCGRKLGRETEIAAGTSSGSATSGFTLCLGTFALCTTAKCTPMRSTDPSAEPQLSCRCDALQGFSAGTKPCSEVPRVRLIKGLVVPSRYQPISATAACFNNRPWAWCLDKSCVVDADTSKATCTCTQMSSTEPYVVVKDRYDATTCTTDIWSSATVDSVLQVTSFLQGSRDLPAKPIAIVGVGSASN
jgi:hypothetical protein